MTSSLYGKLKFHQMLIADKQRSSIYQKAIHKIVKPGDIVIDVGSGSGLLSMFAVQAGAAKVYAIEKTDIIEIAKYLAIENNMDKQIEFIHQDAFQVELPEKADVIVSELISKAVIGQQMEAIILRIKERFLKPGGSVIPEKVDLMVAPVNAWETYKKAQFPARDEYGLSFSSINNIYKNHIKAGRVNPDQLIAQPQTAYRLDCNQLSKEQYPKANLKFEITQKTILHGFVSWFNAHLGAGIYLDNTNSGASSWNNSFFFLPEPVELDSSADVELKILGKEFNTRQCWSWVTNIQFHDDCVDNLQFEQNNFDQIVPDLALLNQLRPEYIPALTLKGSTIVQILNTVQQGLTIEDIESDLHLDSQTQALRLISELYSINALT